MKPSTYTAKERKRSKESERRGEQRRRKENIKTAVSLYTQNVSAHAQTSQADIVHLELNNLETALWYVLALDSQRVTIKRLDQLQNAFFYKIPRGELVKYTLFGLVSQRKFFKQFQEKH